MVKKITSPLKTIMHYVTIEIFNSAQICPFPQIQFFEKNSSTEKFIGGAFFWRILFFKSQVCVMAPSRGGFGKFPI